MKSGLFVSLAFALLALGCECGHHDEEAGSTEGESETEVEGADEGEPEAPAAHATGPLGWTAVVESETAGDAEERQEDEEEEYREHRLLLWRTGPATTDRAADMAELGHFSNWQGVFTLYVASEEPGAERPLTLFGIRGTCEATATRVLHLHVAYEPHHGDDEERLYDALEFEGCDGPYAFGAEGSITYEELSTRTMETPPEEIAAVVHDREQAITDELEDEPMRLVGRELPAFHVWVLSGWETYFVRGTEIVTSTDDGILAAVTIGARSVLLVRGDDGPMLETVGEHGLERVDPDAAPESAATTPAAPE
jgi:hypothetical protein